MADRRLSAVLPRPRDGEARVPLPDGRYACDHLPRVAPGMPYTTTYRTDWPGVHEFVRLAVSASDRPVARRARPHATPRQRARATGLRWPAGHGRR
jgi:hypothetical protein